jgi:hypothetical protein
MSTALRQIPVLTNGESSVGKRSPRGILTLAFFIVVGFIAIAADSPPAPIAEQAAASVFSAGRAMRHVVAISRVPHPIHSPGHDAVRDYIVGKLQEIGLTPQVQRITNADEGDGSESPLENIVCRLPGSTHEKAILLVAHYDSVAAGPGASDDGVAVAALLEGARALKSLPQLKRDVIFLFSDGEEAGMLGAQAFVNEHPWAHDAGLVLNFEARGTNGPSIMFETSDDNGWLISGFGRSASHPVANSLSYEIYKRLPNDTDFSIFRQAGYSGLNFAFIGGLAYYHSPLDSIENVSLGSLQHHGDYVLELARQFGNAASDDPKSASLVYFDVLGRLLVRYSQSAATFFLALTGVLLTVALFLGLKKQYVRIGACLLGLACMVLCVGVTVVGAEAAFWFISALQERLPAIHVGLWYHSGLYVLAFSAIGLACAMAFYSFVSKWISSDNLTSGSLLGWFGLTIAVSVYFPGASYLFLWPLLFSLSGWIAVSLARPTANAKSLVLGLSAVPAIVLMAPMIHKIFFAFAAHSTLIVSALLGLVFALVIAQITQETSRRWLLPLLLAVAGTGLMVMAVIASAGDKGLPEPAVSLVNVHEALNC